MDTHKALKTMLESSRLVTTLYLRDLDDSDLLVRPFSGTNNLAWQLGHLLVSEAEMLDGIEPGASPALPPGFVEVHSKKNAGILDVRGLLTKEEYLELHDQQRAATLELLDRLSVCDLDRPGPGASAKYAPTVGSLFVMISTHEALHAGQIAVVRRYLEKPIVM